MKMKKDLIMSKNRNDVTGDVITSKVNSDKYQSNFDAIFRKDKPANERDNHGKEETEKKNSSN